MSRYFRSSYYYPDDKDIYDFLKSTNAPIDSLLGFMKAQGIYGSERDSRDSLCDHISTYYLSWNRAESMVDLVNVRDSEPPKATIDYKWEGKTNDLGDALEVVKALRSNRDREGYVINKEGDGYSVKVAYVDVENGKTRLLQQREQEITFHIEKSAGGFQIRYDNVERSPAIIANILGALQEKETDETRQELKGSRVSLSGINSAKRRVSFFRKMMNGLDGFRLRGVSHIRTDRMAAESVTEDDSEAAQEEADEEIQRLIFYGRGLWETTEFQALVDKGFYVSGATWRCESSTPGREYVELTVGFDKTTQGEELHYKLLGIYNRDEHGELKPVRERIPKDLQSTILVSLHNASTRALADILEEQRIEEEASSVRPTAPPVATPLQTDEDLPTAGGQVEG